MKSYQICQVLKINDHLRKISLQVKDKLEKDQAYQAITLESERIRLFKEYQQIVEESCSHHHAKKKKSKKHKNKHSRSKSKSVRITLGLFMKKNQDGERIKDQGYGVNATFNNMSVIMWRSVLFVEETSRWQTCHIMLYRVHLV